MVSVYSFDNVNQNIDGVNIILDMLYMCWGKCQYKSTIFFLENVNNV
jgi:hypothetical protein